MPNRVLRNWADSFSVNELDANAERFFVRLIMTVDDYGRYHADERILKSHLFPLKPDIRTTDITRWIAACETAGLITTYIVAKKKYLEINNFKQQLRQKLEKFPKNQSVINDTQMHSRYIADDSLETEVETEVEVEKNISIPPCGGEKQKSFKHFEKKDLSESLKPFLVTYGKDTLNAFFAYWSEPMANGKMRMTGEKAWDISRRLSTWNSRNSSITNNSLEAAPKRRKL